MTSRRIRYIALNGEDYPASYNCSLGDRAARDWAIQNARTYRGQVICQYADGETEVVRDFRRSRAEEPDTGSV